MSFSSQLRPLPSFLTPGFHFAQCVLHTHSVSVGCFHGTIRTFGWGEPFCLIPQMLLCLKVFLPSQDELVLLVRRPASGKCQTYSVFCTLALNALWPEETLGNSKSPQSSQCLDPCPSDCHLPFPRWASHAKLSQGNCRAMMCLLGAAVFSQSPPCSWGSGCSLSTVRILVSWGPPGPSQTLQKCFLEYSARISTSRVDLAYFL